MNYEEEIAIFKALSDTNRLKIMKTLSCSCGEMCACHILEHFDITQPTLSHHMKILIDSGLVVLRKEGSWNHYSMNKEKLTQISEFIKNITTDVHVCGCNCKGGECNHDGR